MNKILKTIKIIIKGAKRSPIIKMILCITGIVGFAGIISILPRLISGIVLISLLVILALLSCYLEGLKDD